MKYSIPYGKGTTLEFETYGNPVIFKGENCRIPKIEDLKEAVIEALNNPIASPPLKDLAKDKKNIVILVEDNTRETPLDILLPIIVGYLNDCGVYDDAITILTAPGTHRIMTNDEIARKLGAEIVGRFKIMQHDATRSEEIADLGSVETAGYKVPVHVNRLAVEADLLIGVGNIVPHSDAGYSGGAKIVQPGICDFVTTAATHATAAFCPDIPLGMLEGNPCRAGIDAVGKIVGLGFILNVVKNCDGDICGIFAGDCVEAHRAGAAMAENSYKIEIEELADIVVVSSYPADLDFWQATKGVISAYFAVKEGGILVFAAPCYEGLAHNHPRFTEWLALDLDEALRRLRAASPYDTEADLVSAVLSVDNCRVTYRTKVFMVTEGLSAEEVAAVKYTKFPDIQTALDEALKLMPDAKIGILPMGGISLPVLNNQ